MVDFQAEGGGKCECGGFCTNFLKSNTFISNSRLKLAKNQANTKQHPEPELLLFKKFLRYFSSFHSNRGYSKK